MTKLKVESHKKHHGHRGYDFKILEHAHSKSKPQGKLKPWSGFKKVKKSKKSHSRKY